MIIMIIFSVIVIIVIILGIIMIIIIIWSIIVILEASSGSFESTHQRYILRRLVDPLRRVDDGISPTRTMAPNIGS